MNIYVLRPVVSLELKSTVHCSFYFRRSQSSNKNQFEGEWSFVLRDSSLEAQGFSICFASRLLGVVSPSALPSRDLMPILLNTTIINCATSNNKAEMAMFTNTRLEYEPTDKRSGSEVRLFRDTSLLIIDGHLSIHPPSLRSANFP